MTAIGPGENHPGRGQSLDEAPTSAKTGGMESESSTLENAIRIRIVIQSGQGEPFVHPSIVWDEGDLPDALESAFYAFRTTRPDQSLFDAEIKIESA